MPITLDEIAVTVFKNILDENHDNIITPNEAAQGINQHLLPPIIQSFPGIQTDSTINPASLGEFLNENGTIGDGELKALLEQYFEFLANKTTNPPQNIIAFQNEFNNYYGQQPENFDMEVDEDDFNNFDMEVDEDDFNNPAINPAAVNHVFNEQGANQRDAPPQNEEDDQLQRAIALSLEDRDREERQIQWGPRPGASARGATAPGATAPGASARGATASPAAAPAPKPKTLAEINEIIQVFDPTEGRDIPAPEFLREWINDNPFIIRATNGTFHGNAIKWPAPSNAGKFYVECLDETPGGFLGNNYGRYTKPNGRHFVKLDVAGSKTFVITPPWYINGNPPGTKYFQLVPAGKVFKFMSEVVQSQRIPPDDHEFFVGAEHCAQTHPVGIYVLQPISLSELNTIVDNIVAEGGKRNRKSKSKNLRKIKNKYNKFTRKGIKKNKIIINKLNKKQKTRKGYIKNKKQTRHRKK